ncbi:major coat protein [Providencia huaxiensis]|uniref:major coat protein n=1 Tax=Providencia huaxiensis TaxID=2027290 RepID=UPI0037580EE7
MLKKLKYSLITLSVLSLSPSVFAAEGDSALPQVVKDSITGVGSTATEMMDLLWPVIALVATGWIAIKLFKKGTSKV